MGLSHRNDTDRIAMAQHRDRKNGSKTSGSCHFLRIFRIEEDIQSLETSTYSPRESDVDYS